MATTNNWLDKFFAWTETEGATVVAAGLFLLLIGGIVCWILST